MKRSGPTVNKYVMKKQIFDRPFLKNRGSFFRGSGREVTRTIFDSTASKPEDHESRTDSGTELEGVAWPLNLFTVPGYENPDPQQTIDLTGRWRLIIFGPYIELPAGTWEAKLRFRLDVEGGSNFLGFHWGGLDVSIVDFHTRLTVSGDYEIRMVNSWKQPSVAEFRVLVHHPTFQGKFTFLECRVTQRAL